MKCSHCHLEYPIDKLTHICSDGEDLYFCCNGCQSVYFLLQQSGFGGFYERLGTQTLSPVGNQSNKQDFSYLDSPNFLEANTKKIGQEYEVSLIIGGIHCAACVWLNEHILGQKDGISKAQINYTNNKAKIVFNPQIIKLSEIFRLIESIGYSAHIYDANTQEKQILAQKKSYFIAFVVGVFCTMNIMWIAVAQYAGYFQGMSQDMKDILNLVSCLLATPVLFYTGRVFYAGAYYGLKNGYIGMDFLVAFGASLTFIYSIYAAISRSGETYFESVAMIILFVFSGKFLEMRAKSIAGDSLDSLYCALPTFVCVESAQGIIQKDIKQVQVGDIIQAKPGEMIACDGVLLESEALFDMQSLSGESMPVCKKHNEAILSGSIVLERGIRYKVSKTYETSMMSHIIQLLEESLSHRPRIQNLANALSKNFSRIVLCIALCGFIGWYIADGDTQHALIVAISVIVISCPCALALATPIASVAGISRAYKNALLFKEARFLESLAKAKYVFLDKTGTLTIGKPRLKSQHILAEFDTNVLAHFVAFSAHPISQALLRTFTPKGSLCIVDFVQVDSRGISARYNEQSLLGGSLEFLAQNKILGIESFLTKLESNVSQVSPLSVFGYAVNGVLVAVFYFEDEPKKNAKEFVSYLKSHNKMPIILSGDRLSVVESLAKSLEITRYYANLLPTQKSDIVRQESGAVMIGDGLNDILALNSAEVGISMGAGSDVAIAQSDVVILDDSLVSLQKAFEISSHTYTRIKQNLAISLVYNSLMIPIALAGFIIPLIAALSMSLSSLIVVFNSLRK